MHGNSSVLTIYRFFKQIKRFTKVDFNIERKGQICNDCYLICYDHNSKIPAINVKRKSVD